MLIILKELGISGAFIAQFVLKSVFFGDIAAVYPVEFGLICALHHVYLFADHILVRTRDEDLSAFHGRYKAQSPGLIEFREYVIQDKDRGRGDEHLDYHSTFASHHGNFHRRHRSVNVVVFLSVAHMSF